MENKKKDKPDRHFMNNPVIHAFLQTGDHKALFSKARLSPTERNIANLDAAFKAFYCEIRFIKYVSIIIHSYSISYDKRQRRNKKNQFTLSTLSAEESEPGFCLSERESSLEEAVVDPLLYQGLLSLTNKEKEILEFSYIKSMSDTLIAKRQGVSQQTISKTRKRALRKLREKIDQEGGRLHAY